MFRAGRSRFKEIGNIHRWCGFQLIYEWQSYPSCSSSQAYRRSVVVSAHKKECLAPHRYVGECHHCSQSRSGPSIGLQVVPTRPIDAPISNQHTRYSIDRRFYLNKYLIPHLRNMSPSEAESSQSQVHHLLYLTAVIEIIILKVNRNTDTAQLSLQ